MEAIGPSDATTFCERRRQIGFAIPRVVSQKCSHEAFRPPGRIKGMSTPAIRKRLADRLSSEVTIAIEGIRRVWCCSASVGKRRH
jgi:hypothetical protein